MAHELSEGRKKYGNSRTSRIMSDSGNGEGKELTLTEFVYMCSESLSADAQATDDLAHLMLSGIMADAQEVVVNSVSAEYAIPFPGDDDDGADFLNGLDSPLFVRDYDSMIATSRTLPYISALQIYAVARSADSLTKDVHIQHPVQIRRGGNQTSQMPLHRIPNMGFAEFGGNGLVRAFFPNLPKSAWSTTPGNIPEEYQDKFYQDILRPSLLEIAPLYEPNWPVSRNVEKFRITKHSQGGGYPYHQIIGVKHTTDHQLMNDVESTQALQILMQDFLWMGHHLMENFACYVDVGLEIHCPDHVVLWKASSHRALAQFALQCTPTDAIEATRPGSDYRIDYPASIVDLAGCRICPKNNSVRYLQAYHTEKSGTSNAENGERAKGTNCWAALTSSKGYTNFCKGLYNFFSASMEGELGGSARLEVRVPFAEALTALPKISPDVYCEICVRIPSRMWWNYKLYRLMALQHVIGQSWEGSGSLRSAHASLALVAACVYHINALNRRPGWGKAEHDLLICTHPITNDIESAEALYLISGLDGNPFALFDEARERAENRREENESERDEEDDESEDDVWAPYANRGIIFLERVMLASNKGVTVPRMRTTPHIRHGQILKLKSYQIFFSRSYNDVRAHIYPVGYAEVRDPNRRRIPRKAVPLLYEEVPNTEGSTAFHLEQAGHVAPQQPVDEGSDNDVEDLVREDPDLVVRGKNQQDYSRVSEEECHQATEELYKNTELSDVFSACQLRPSSIEQWNGCYEKLFPRPGTVLDIKESVGLMKTYHGDWQRLINSITPTAAVAARREVRRKWDSLLWAPFRSSARLWDSHQDKTDLGILLTSETARSQPSRSAKISAPRIALNPAFGHTVKWRGTQYFLGVKGQMCCAQHRGWGVRGSMLRAGSLEGLKWDDEVHDESGNEHLCLYSKPLVTGERLSTAKTTQSTWTNPTTPPQASSIEQKTALLGPSVNYSSIGGSHGTSSASAGDWQGDHDMQVATGNDAWVSVFGGHSDPELSDGAPAIAMGWKAEHKRHIAANNTNWIRVYGSSSDVEVSDAEETSTEGASGRQKSAEELILHELVDKLEEAWNWGFIADETAGNWRGPFGALRAILTEQFESDGGGDESNAAKEDYEAVVDLLSTDLIVGRYLAGHLLLNVGFFVEVLPPAIERIYTRRAAVIKDTKRAARQAKELVSVLFVRPQNGSKDLHEHPCAGNPYLRNYQGSVSDDTRAKISAWDENTIDHLAEVVKVAFPKLIEEDYISSSYYSSVPPSGARGFAASGAAGSNFLAAQHIKPYTDPEWTMGMTLSEGDRCPRAYNFCFSALDNGRGVIALNYAYTAHIWRGKAFLHGGTVGPSTFIHKDPVIGLGVYQKTRMQSQARKDAAMFPKTFKIPVGLMAFRWGTPECIEGPVLCS
ncbi:hypothetical protein BS47DRAFT_1357309 [Hydnum rufescens UP504]|uniref:Uncharacterized protein n=1 Tax=Hydnum rufescens UP504 TaxID=1448309 RepID=A0A9P6E214_9AGAM|nr:hypothetical protein BS47DRAFT_1357309 [Hydnum rufescens UP504]